MNTQHDEHRAFKLGWEFGYHKWEASPAKADRLLLILLKRFPTQGETDAFGQGTVDGAAKDCWRLRRLRVATTVRCLCGHVEGLSAGHNASCNTDAAFIHRGEDVPQDQFTKSANRVTI